MSFQLRRESTGELLLLDDTNVLGAGGEATVYSVPNDRSLAAKVYLKPSNDRAQKLLVMLASPPAETSPGAPNPQIAWPQDLLWTTGRKSQIAGFLMPRIEGMAPIIDIYSPHARLMSRPWFDYRLLLKTFISLSGAVEMPHQAGYVIGDLNHSNIFVADDARVTLIDADSFQVRDPNGGAVFLCPVYTPAFTAPELHHQGLIKTERSLEQDDFGLGVLAFLMLMGGLHPFSGVQLGQGEAPPLFSGSPRGISLIRGRGAPWSPRHPLLCHSRHYTQVSRTCSTAVSRTGTMNRICALIPPSGVKLCWKLSRIWQFARPTRSINMPVIKRLVPGVYGLGS